MDWTKTFLHSQRRSLRFCLFFVACLGGLAVVFELSKSFFAWAYMYPVSSTAAGLLDLMAFEATLNTARMPLGFCELVLNQITYRVTFDCTGLFALLVFLSLTAAYPVTLRKKGVALLLGVPAIFVFSSLRLVVLGVVAYVQPAWIELFHVYVMELATLGFMLYVWKYWVNSVSVKVDAD